MNEQIKALYNTLQSELRIFENENMSPIKRLSGKLDASLQTADTLKLYLDSTPFANTQDEINYFKYEKPLFVCEQFYAQHIFTIETKRRELADLSAVHNYYHQELAFTRHYFSQHQFLHQYYKLEATELDSLLFLRGAETSPVILPETPDLDPRYSTKGDFLFSKFISHERIMDYLTGQLYPSIENRTLKNALRWTGDKMNLVELAYAIYDTAQINNGDIEIKEIIDWLENTLNINLGRYYRMFSEMKDRKMVSPTRFLDHAAAMLQEHLRRGDTFRPQVPPTVSGSKSVTKK